ncbi:hypothetical protein ACIO93_17020 [Streptomyces sp. NPDC087903]|uniref:hypothetical protein n=1 Tax=Streptomyces sp. NPDC087903 TaxID=3365819 RepID=UPI0037F991D5
MKHWRTLIVLGAAQFPMVLATSVMNVSISRLVEDFDTEVTVGGLQFTAQNLGSALIGSILIGAPANAFTSQVEDNPGLSEEAQGQTSVALEAGISFVPTDEVRSAAERAGLPPAEVDAVADSYASAQLQGLKAATLATGGITLARILVTRHVPTGGAGRGSRPDTAAPADALDRAR